MKDESAAFSQRLDKLSSSALSDVLDACGYRNQVLSVSIAPLARGMRVAGPAVCFAGRAASSLAHEPAGTKLSSYDIDHQASAGNVLLISTGGYRTSSVMGGLMALGFSEKDCAGVVTDGSVRDVAEILELKLPTFCTGASPLNSTGRWQLTGVNVSISLPGQDGAAVDIAPGDFVVGDADGIVVIPQRIAADVISWTERLNEIEANIVHEMKRGGVREQVFSNNPRFSHIKRLK